jgi:spermidine synthase
VGGTILIGYVLIPLFPNSMTMYLTAAVLLATAGAYFVVWERKLAVPAVILVLVGGGLGYLGAARPTLSESAGMTELYRANSNFGLLQVMDEKVMKRRVYLNDLLTQNTYNPGTGQSDSLFTYMLHDLARAYAAEVRTVLCIGMGVGIVPRQFAREGVKVDVVEINPAVAPLATRFFDFRPEQVNLLIGDGRYWVNQPGPAYDAIILDAFLGESPPAHLMTREAFAAMKRRLRPGGVLVMNSFGEFRAGRDFLTASLERTLRLVFPSLRVHAAGNGNVFYVASDQRELRLLHPPDFADMPEGLRYLANLAMEGTMQTDATHGRVLTDDYNPVEFYDAANREELRRRLALSYQPSDND